MTIDQLMRMSLRKAQVVICVDANAKVIRSAIELDGHLIDRESSVMERKSISFLSRLYLRNGRWRRQNAADSSRSSAY